MAANLPGLRLQSDLVAVCGLFQLLATGLVAVVELRFGTPELGQVCLLALLPNLLALWSLRRGAEPTRVGALLLGLAFVLVSIANLGSGGAALGANIALPSMALFAALIFPLRTGLCCVALITAELLVVAWLRDRGLEFPIKPDPAWTARAVDRVPLLFSIASALVGILLRRAMVQFRADLALARSTETVAREGAASSAMRLAGFAELAADGFWETDFELRLSYISDGFAQMLGLPVTAMLGLTPDQAWRLRFPDAALLDGYMQPLRERRAFVNQELRITDADGAARILLNRGKPLFGNDGGFRGFRGAVHDVSALRTAELAVRASERRLRLITDHLPALIWYIDRDLVFRFNNSAHSNWLKRPLEQITGKHLSEVLDLLTFRRLQPHLAQALAGAPLRVELSPVPGRNSYLRVDLVPDIEHEKVLGVYGLIHDITTLKQETYAEREKSERMLLMVAEHEQERLGRDLHDGLGQELAGAAFMAKGLAHLLQTEGHPRAPDADEIKQILRRSVESMRALSRQLSPTELESGEILTALERLCADVERSYSIHCSLRIDAGARLLCEDISSHAARQLYRISQEALNNATRHGGCRHLYLWLRQRGHELSLTIADDGSGFAGGLPRINRTMSGLGLPSMRLRAHGLGGRMRFGRRRGLTFVVLRVPGASLASPDPIQRSYRGLS